jgi:hypothetical protein
MREIALSLLERSRETAMMRFMVMKQASSTSLGCYIKELMGKFVW